MIHSWLNRLLLPDPLGTGSDSHRFPFAQVEQGAQPPKMNGQASALRFFFTITLGRADLAHQLAARTIHGQCPVYDSRRWDRPEILPVQRVL